MECMALSMLRCDRLSSSLHCKRTVVTALPLPSPAVSRHVFVTPLRIVPQRPTAELDSNRVLRKYSPFDDRFIRVTFADEALTPLSSYTARDLRGSDRCSETASLWRGVDSCSWRTATANCESKQPISIAKHRRRI